MKQKQVPLDPKADEIEDTATLPPVSVAKKATAEAVREASQRCRSRFAKWWFSGNYRVYSTRISEVSGVPFGTVMSRLARARHQLYLMLSDRKQHDQL
jgi:DNA-directed RNA polymerase specialized sigma24 family protein